MLVKDAEKIIHSLSEPSKMPGYGYGLPTYACVTGHKLSLIPDSVCSSCYAKHGHYSFKPCQSAQTKRLMSIDHPDWVEAMVTVLRGKKVRYFRWHDSGDLQSVKHLRNIISVADKLPGMMFWLPTKEADFLTEYFKTSDYVPPNLCIRLSATMIDGKPAPVSRYRGGVQTCTVHRTAVLHPRECPAPTTNGECRTCRACWDKSVANVSYKEH